MKLMVIRVELIELWIIIIFFKCIWLVTDENMGLK